MFIYVSVALVAVGNLSITDLIRVKENALAVAAEPFLGKLGFLFISLGALFSCNTLWWSKHFLFISQGRGITQDF